LACDAARQDEPSSRRQASDIHKTVEARAIGGPKSVQIGSLVLVRYSDHVLFKDVDPSLCVPWTRETIGWLDYEDSNYVRLVWERFAMPDPPRESKPRATGLVILKKAIVELRRVSA